MPFSILRHLNHLDIQERSDSYIKAKCPVCEGSLKIALAPHAKGAYRCWTNNCDPKDIRERMGLGISRGYMQPTKPSGPLISRPIKVKFRGGSLARMLSPYTSPTVRERKVLDVGVVKQTIYRYGDTKAVYRSDFPANHKYKKTVFPRYLDNTGEWQWGKGGGLWPLYIENLGCIEGDIVLFVEGEKAASFCKAQGIATITAASCVWTESSLWLALDDFRKSYPQVTSIIYVSDHDNAGVGKADKVQKACHRAGYGFMHFEITYLWPTENCPIGADLADLNSAQFQQAIEKIEHDVSRRKTED